MTDYPAFYRPTPYNKDTKEQIWQTTIIDIHDSFCGCCQPICHLLNLVFPPDHKDRHTSINDILSREQTYQQCLFTGEEEKDGGGENNPVGEKEDFTNKEEKDFTNLDVDELLAAAADAEKR